MAINKYSINKMYFVYMYLYISTCMCSSIFSQTLTFTPGVYLAADL